MWNSKIDVPLYIGNEEVRTGDTKTMSAPIQTHRGYISNHILKTRLQPHFKLKRLGQIWPGNNALEFFLKAAELLAGYRAKNQCSNHDCPI
jgi:1-pyrroline-5-carboxylate dehydrogenase